MQIPDSIAIDYDEASDQLVLLDEHGNQLMWLDEDFSEVVRKLLTSGR